MVVAPSYSLHTQAKMVPALCVLHNFIRDHDADDLPAEAIGDDGERESETIDRVLQVDHLGRDVSRVEIRRAGERRDTIARTMWQDYQRVLAQRNGN